MGTIPCFHHYQLLSPLSFLWRGSHYAFDGSYSGYLDNLFYKREKDQTGMTLSEAPPHLALCSVYWSTRGETCSKSGVLEPCVFKYFNTFAERNLLIRYLSNPDPGICNARTQSSTDDGVLPWQQESLANVFALQSDGQRSCPAQLHLAWWYHAAVHSICQGLQFHHVHVQRSGSISQPEDATTWIGRQLGHQ